MLKLIYKTCSIVKNCHGWFDFKEKERELPIVSYQDGIFTVENDEGDYLAIEENDKHIKKVKLN